ncbi:SMI1/KNR4 family protein [Myroides pelagicus]|uniref:Cell wall assembly protein n=1 Tax=Myroides pelagicus TaxID=270914 RepID=A0A7K1GN05_9FLAO|nr:SMI1/KNR4 family protein [Myroides pelagicus]MEC4113178.1 SMI1/KNR4 family protein [Myroides pelagicus]MTH29773.1 cell wall assembly protein [Myroides pelagicus]
MVNLNFRYVGFLINDTYYDFPIPIESLISEIGQPEIVSSKANTIYIWHEVGLRAFAKEKGKVDGIEVPFVKAEHRNAPRSVFSGTITISDDYDPMTYYEINKEDRVKLWPEDPYGAFAFCDVCVWYGMRDGKLESLTIRAYSEEESIDTLAVDPQFAYLEDIWTNWKGNILEFVDKQNKYYNLKPGITQEELNAVLSSSEELTLPAELINFYKGGDVYWNAVTSVFGFNVNGWIYDLLPFEKIVEEWEEVNGVIDEDEEVEEELIAEFDKKLKCRGYVNKHWIPIAEGRNGDYLLYDTDPSESGVYGQIIELQNESWQRNVVASSLKELIENEIVYTKANSDEKFEFVLENGAF